MRQDHSIILPDPDDAPSHLPAVVTIEAEDHHDTKYASHTRDPGLRPVNLRFLVVGAVSLVVLVGLIHVLHGYQVRRMSSHLREQANDALAAGQANEAIGFLRGYLQLEPEDREARDQLAYTMVDSAETPQERYEVFLLLGRMLTDDPTQRDVRRHLMELCMSGGRFNDAIEHLKILLTDAPNDDQLHLLLARSYAATGESLQAAAEYESAIRGAPRNFHACEELAELLHDRLDEEEKAQSVMDEMVASANDAHEAWLARARFFQRLGQIENAESDALRALHFGPDDPNVLKFVAGLVVSSEHHKNKFNVDQVYAALIRALEKNGNDVELVIAIAQVESHRGRLDLAEQRLRKAMQQDPEDLQLGWRLAEMLIAQSKLNEARLEIQHLRELKLARPLEEYLEARIEMMEGHWLAAITKFDSVRHSSASMRAILPQINLCLGQCYENLGHVEQQLSAYRDATNQNESSEIARLGLARSLAGLGRTEDALLHYDLVRDLQGVDIQIARLLIQRNLQLPPAERNWDEAERALDAAARTDLANSLIVRSLMLIARDQAAQGLQLLERGIKRHPGHAGLRVSLAEMHYQMGRLSEAGSVLDSAAQTLGDRVEILLARIRYAAALNGDAAKSKLQELEESAKRFTGSAQLRVWRALADAAASIGDAQLSQKYLEVVREKTPDDLLVVRSLFSNALQTGSAEAAERWLQEIRRIDGVDGPETRLAEVQKVIVSADQDSVENGRELLNQVAIQLPGSARVALEQAQLETLAGNDDLAIDHYTRAVDLGESDPNVFNRLIRLLYKQRRYAEAGDVLERLKNTSTVPLGGELGRVAAEMSIRSEKLEQACRFAELAVSSESQDYRDHLWLGQILWAAGESERAEQSFRKAISLAPEQHEAWIALIQFLGRNGRSEEAQKELNHLRSRLSEEDAPYTFGQCYQALNQIKEAEEQYRLALKSNPNDEQVLQTLADLCLRTGQWNEAEVLLRRLIDLNPSAGAAASIRRSTAMVMAMRHGYPGFQEGLALLDKNFENTNGTAADRRTKAILLASRPSHRQRREAIVLLETLDESRQLTVEDQVMLIQLYMAEDDVEQARPYMAALVQSHPENPEYMALCIRLLLQHGDASETVMVWLEKLEQLQPDEFQTIELRARALAARNKADEALTLLRNLAGRPSDGAEQHDQQVGRVAAVMAQLAAQFDRSGRPQLAEPLATAAEEMYRDVASRHPEQIIDLIRFLGRNWQPEKAFALCETAWQTVPPQQVAGVCVELLRTREASPEQLQQVQRRIQTALLRDPESAELMFQLGNASHLAGDYAAAEVMYRRAIEKAPQTPLSAMVSNELAVLLALHRHEPGEAVRLIDRAVEISGPSSFLLDTRATAHLVAGDADKAIRDLEAAIDDQPDAVNRFHLAQAYLLSGDTAAASAAWRESLSLGLHLKGIHPLERSVFEELNAKLK